MTVVNTNIAETINITSNGQVDVARYTTANVNVEAGGKYQLLSRVKDDSNNEIGTVVGYHTDANNVEYAVVCLDAQFRLASGQYLSENAFVPELPILTNLDLWENAETATSICTKILDFATANGYTSPGVSHCRSKSFVIEGITYYGQLPTLGELIDIMRHRTAINNADTSASQYSTLILANNIGYFSSNQQMAGRCWGVVGSGEAAYYNKIGSCFIIPILELPIQ